MKSSKKRDREDSTTSLDGDGDGVDASQKPCVNPILANILYRSSTNEPSLGVQVNTSIQNNVHNPINRSQQEIARVAVGRGIRHSFSHPLAKKPAPLPSRSTPLDQGESCGESGQPTDTTEVVQASLSALKNNFENSMEAAIGDKASLNDDSGDDSYPRSSYVPGSMRRDDSLVDLAMIPYADDENQSDYNLQSSGLTFIDFPWQDPSMFSDG